MIAHVLAGDSMLDTFRRSGVGGEVIVFREALVTGDLAGETLEEFWNTRANFIGIEYGADPIEYHETVADELIRLLDLGEGDEINLWFEHELFCAANMWFCLDLLSSTSATLFRVAPLDTGHKWDGFAKHTPEHLAACYRGRQAFTPDDIELAVKLWSAFRKRDRAGLLRLGLEGSPRFPHLKEVSEAAAEVDTRPAEIVRRLRASGFSEMETLFPEFQKEARVFGFGDSQVERLLSEQ
jgi:hypothetical protein